MRLFRKAFVTAPRDTAASADRTRPPKRPRAERVFGRSSAGTGSVPGSASGRLYSRPGGCGACACFSRAEGRLAADRWAWKQRVTGFFSPPTSWSDAARRVCAV